MNKNELVEAVAHATGESKKLTEAVINATLNEVTRALATGDKISLIGFGTFEVRDRPAREARNPRTSEPIHIPAGKAPVFKAGKTLKDAVKEK